MTDLTTIFNGLLKQHEASPTRRTFSVDEIDDFLKEAYRINTHISTLHTELTSVRRAYLSTAQPRKTPTPHLRKPGAAQQPSQPPQYLTDRQREEIDSNAKTLLRELNASIRALADAEQLRQDTEAALLRKKHARGGLGGALGAWAAGSGATAGKSTEQQVAEDRARQVSAHREAVLWFLRQRLQVCGRTQQDMMEARLMREVERNRSVLAKAGGPSYAEFAALAGVGPSGGAGSGGSDLAASTGSLGSGSGVKSLAVEEEEKKAVRRDDLTPEQIQMFEKGNHDMLKHYESTLDKVRTAEKSLIEISELQTLLVNNLAMQSEHIDQLVEDSFHTAENIGGGNKQLKKATERSSPARYTFFAAGGLCLFLIVWDLVI